ncbi:MAG: hypothetical protein AAGE01_15420 [Pseudomonadota bacterium]
MARGKARATLELEAAILDVVDERAPITVRGVCYALFTQGRIGSMEVRFTQKVSRIMTGMRESGVLDWTKVVDGSREVATVAQWKDPSQIIDAAVAGYRKDYWKDQPSTVEIWSEKGTVHGVLQPVLREYGVTFRVMKGFGSYTAVRQAAEDSADAEWLDKDFIAFYIGDHDPSGRYMTDVDLPARLERYGAGGRFERIAIVQGLDEHLPSFSAGTKKKDPRHRWFVEHHGVTCWELDAMNPNDLRDRVREHIESVIDFVKWNRAIAVERAERESMHEFQQTWNELWSAN